MRRTILVGLTLVLVVMFYPADVAYSPIDASLEKASSIITSDYVVHDPILITADID